MMQPSMTIPTAVGVINQNNRPNFKASGLEDLDFHIGHDAIANAASCSVNYPVRHGMVRHSVPSSALPEVTLLSAAHCSASVSCNKSQVFNTAPNL